MSLVLMSSGVRWNACRFRSMNCSAVSVVMVSLRGSPSTYSFAARCISGGPASAYGMYVEGKSSRTVLLSRAEIEPITMSAL